jgi:hypothetical protein
LSSVRVGLGASIGVAGGGAGSATGGLETFFIESAGAIDGGGGTTAADTVPEPVTMALIGAGLVGLVVIDKRRRRAA